LRKSRFASMGEWDLLCSDAPTRPGNGHSLLLHGNWRVFSLKKGGSKVLRGHFSPSPQEKDTIGSKEMVNGE
jgi:hypothetical protein